MPVFFIRSTDIHGSIVSISPPLFLHLIKSLRVHQGDTLLLGDEQRRRHLAAVKRVEKHHLVAEIQETQFGPATEEPLIILAQSVLKGEKMNWLIQKATELGVGAIVPLLTHRVIIRLSSAQAKRHQERWQRIALEAAQQAERWEVPTIHAVQSLSSFVGERQPTDLSLVLVEREHDESLCNALFPNQWETGITLMVGPEGGWSEGEVLEAQKSGFQKVSLGTRILRSETATLAALSIMQGRLGHME